MSRSFNLIVVAAMVSAVPSAHAMGAKKPEPSPTCGDGVSVSKTPRPVRRIVLKPMGTKLFPLPNGTQVDLSSELNEMLRTAVAESSSLSPRDPLIPGATDPDCGTYIELRSAMTTLEMNVTQLNLSVGYHPGGIYNPLPGNNATGTMEVKIGLIGMDFSVWECTAGSCTAISAAHSDQKTTQFNLKIQVTWSMVTSAAQLVHNTSFGQVMRDILTQGVNQLAASERINDLPWFAVVRDYVPESGSVVFDAGSRSRIKPDQTFTVLASAPATGVCQVFKPLANVRTTEVNAVSSVAVIDQVLDARKPQDGDVVVIRKAEAVR